VKDLLTKINNTATQKFGAKYAETRAQKLYKTSLTLKEERVEAAKQGIENGVAIRVLVNGAWGLLLWALLTMQFWKAQFQMPAGWRSWQVYG